MEQEVRFGLGKVINADLVTYLLGNLKIRYSFLQDPDALPHCETVQYSQNISSLNQSLLCPPILRQVFFNTSRAKFYIIFSSLSSHLDQMPRSIYPGSMMISTLKVTK